jgi:hypothetical protein
MTRKLEVWFFDFVQGYSRFSKWAINFLQLKNHLENYYFLNYQHGIRRKLRRCSTYNPNQKMFRNMYRNTQSGALQDIDKNKFLLRGINRQRWRNTHWAFNVPEVCCCYCGRKNSSGGIDYSVNYQLGSTNFRPLHWRIQIHQCFFRK